MTLNLGWATDVEVLRLTGSMVEEHSDHQIVRSPHTPLFHWGNFVLVTDERAADDAGGWLSVFTAAFPTARHVALGLPRLPATEAWAEAGIEVSTDDVLATVSRPVQRPLAAGYAARGFRDPADWEQWIDLEAEENDRIGEHEPDSHRAFLRDQAATRARLVDQGHAAWFGAFTADGAGELVSSLGIVRCGELARYQTVGTTDAHRRRGLATHLLGLAAAWADDRGCSTWVIVTETTNPAGRVYRSVGFRPAAGSVLAYRPPPR